MGRGEGVQGAEGGEGNAVLGRVGRGGVPKKIPFE